MKNLFFNAWCPLFGQLPDLDVPENSDEQRLLEIILQARTLLRVPDPDTPHQLQKRGKYKNFPPINKVLNFDGYKIEVARAIFRTADSIFPTYQIQDPYESWATYKSKAVLKYGADQFDPEFICFAADCVVHSPSINSEKIRDYEILAILSIAKAWWAFETLMDDCLSYDKSGLQEALGLLGKAQVLLGKVKIELEVVSSFERGKTSGISEQNKANARKPRPDPMTKLIQKNYMLLCKEGKEPSARDVWNKLGKSNTEVEIDTFKKDSLEYYDPKSGKSKTLQYSAFKIRLSRIKNPSSQK